MADGVDPEEFLRELTSLNENPGTTENEPPGPIPSDDPERGRRRTEAAAVAASDGRRSADHRRVKGDVATTVAAGEPSSPRAPQGRETERKSLIGLLVAAIVTVLALSWVATSCLGDDTAIVAGPSDVTGSTDSSNTTSSTTTTTTTTTTEVPAADLGADATAALSSAGISGITPTASGSTIVLTGEAPDEATKAAAQAAVEAVAGIEAVDNQITIAAARDITAEANQALAGAGIEGVMATVAGDVATLTGEAANGEQRLAAELAVLSISGIESVDNQITTPPTPAEILTGTLNDIVLADPIQFNTGSADIRTASQPILDQVAQVLAGNPNGAVEIGGHTDSDGGSDANRLLSQERAQAVLDYLVSKGVDPARLTATGFGEDSPLVANDSTENKRKNRRIEFKVV